MPLASEVTSDFLYIRLEGDRSKVKGTLGRMEVDRENDTRRWAERIKPYLNKEMNVFGYFGKYYSGFPPLDIVLLTNLLAGNAAYDSTKLIKA